MDWLFLLLLGLVLFFVRDVLLLGSFGARRSFLKALALYSGIFLSAFIALGTAADFLSREAVLDLLGDRRWWLPAILVHGVLALGFFGAKRSARARRRSFALALLPAPVFLYCAGGLCWLTLSQNTALDGTGSGVLLGITWVALTAGGAWGVRRFGAGQPGGEPRGVAGGESVGETQRESAGGAILDFAAAANLSAILLLPLHQQSQPGGLVEQALDGGRQAAALAATAGLIGASFLFHRIRRSP